MLAVLAGISVNLAGGITRHFLKHGYTAGAATFDAKLFVNLRFSATIPVNSLNHARMLPLVDPPADWLELPLSDPWLRPDPTLRADLPCLGRFCIT